MQYLLFSISLAISLSVRLSGASFKYVSYIPHS